MSTYSSIWYVRNGGAHQLVRIVVLILSLWAADVGAEVCDAPGAAESEMGDEACLSLWTIYAYRVIGQGQIRIWQSTIEAARDRTDTELEFIQRSIEHMQLPFTLLTAKSTAHLLGELMIESTNIAMQTVPIDESAGIVARESFATVRDVGFAILSEKALDVLPDPVTLSLSAASLYANVWANLIHWSYNKNNGTLLVVQNFLFHYYQGMPSIENVAAFVNTPSDHRLAILDALNEMYNNGSRYNRSQAHQLTIEYTKLINRAGALKYQEASDRLNEVQPIPAIDDEVVLSVLLNMRQTRYLSRKQRILRRRMDELPETLTLAQISMLASEFSSDQFYVSAIRMLKSRVPENQPVGEILGVLGTRQSSHRQKMLKSLRRAIPKNLEVDDVVDLAGNYSNPFYAVMVYEYGEYIKPDLSYVEMLRLVGPVMGDDRRRILVEIAPRLVQSISPQQLVNLSGGARMECGYGCYDAALRFLPKEISASDYQYLERQMNRRRHVNRLRRDIDRLRIQVN